MYRITADRAHRRVDIDFIGSYADIDQARLSAELRAAALGVKAPGGHFDLIADFTQASVMPQDRTAAARETIEWCLANGLRRSANVISSAIAGMQLQRLAGDDRFRNFASRAAALAWRDAPD